MKTHLLGLDVQSLGPPNSNGIVLQGFAVMCGAPRCHERFMIAAEFTEWSRKPVHLTCPYCGTRKLAIPEKGTRVMDLRPIWED